MSTQAPAGQKYCKDCGSLINIKAEICPKCGVRQAAVGGKSKTTAALLAIFLGGVGLHKFYLGNIGMGVLYLIFSPTLIPLIVGIVEGIQLLGMSEEAFAAKYN